MLESKHCKGYITINFMSFGQRNDKLMKKNVLMMYLWCRSEEVNEIIVLCNCINFIFQHKQVINGWYSVYLKESLKIVIFSEISFILHLNLSLSCTSEVVSIRSARWWLSWVKLSLGNKYRWPPSITTRKPTFTL